MHNKLKEIVLSTGYVIDVDGDKDKTLEKIINGICGEQLAQLDELKKTQSNIIDVLAQLIEAEVRRIHIIYGAPYLHILFECMKLILEGLVNIEKEKKPRSKVVKFPKKKKTTKKKPTKKER